MSVYRPDRFLDRSKWKQVLACGIRKQKSCSTLFVDRKSHVFRDRKIDGTKYIWVWLAKSLHWGTCPEMYFSVCYGFPRFYAVSTWYWKSLLKRFAIFIRNTKYFACFQTSVFNKNPFAWSKDGSSYEITSPVVTVNMADRKGRRKLRKLTMRLKRGESTPVPTPDPYSTEQSRSGPNGWLFHRLTLRSGSSAVVTRFQLPADMSRVEAYFRTGRAPTSSRSVLADCSKLPPPHLHPRQEWDSWLI